MLFRFWYCTPDGKWVKREYTGDLELLKEKCNDAMAWMARWPGGLVKVYSPGNFSTKLVGDAVDELVRVLGIRERNAARQARSAQAEAVGVGADDIPF